MERPYNYESKHNSLPLLRRNYNALVLRPIRSTKRARPDRAQEMGRTHKYRRTRRTKLRRAPTARCGSDAPRSFIRSQSNFPLKRSSPTSAASAVWWDPRTARRMRRAVGCGHAEDATFGWVEAGNLQLIRPMSVSDRCAWVGLWDGPPRTIFVLADKCEV